MKVNDIVELGIYPQGKNNEVLPIEWKVIEIKDGLATLMSVHILDCGVYDDISKDHSWENSYIRHYLNNEFFKKSKLAGYVEKIRDEHGVSDFISLLTIKQAREVVKLEDFKATPTEYAKKVNNGILNVEKGYCCFWLKDHGFMERTAAYIGYQGRFYKGGIWMHQRFGYRPVCYIYCGNEKGDS